MAQLTYSPVQPEPAPDRPRTVANRRTLGDRVFRAVTRGGGIATFALIGVIGLFLVVSGWEALSEQGLSFFTTFEWNPDSRQFGIAVLVYGSAVIAAIALSISIPVSILTALFVNEYAPLRVRRALIAMIDLLAAIPSLVYGLWGLDYLQPQLLGVSEFLSDHFGFIPIFHTTEDRFFSSYFITGVVVSLMTLPITTSVIREVFSQTPPVEKEGALALGSTRWGMIRTVVIPFGRGGIIGGSMLGLGRALGETIAVAIIIAPVFDISGEILQTGGNSVASLIALRFSEADEFGRSALVAAGLALFVLTLIVNMIASIVVSRSRSGAGVEL